MNDAARDLYLYYKTFEQHKILYNKYYISYEKILSNRITHIIYSDKFHILACYKDFLIFEDPGEFLKRFYFINESIVKIKGYTQFYELNSKIFPNYVSLPESKYIFKNIKKKQKMLDNLNENEINNSSDNNNNENNDVNNNNDDYEKIFNKSVLNIINFESSFSKNSNSSENDNNSIKNLIKKIKKYDINISSDNNNNNSFYINNNNKIEYSILDNNSKKIYNSNNFNSSSKHHKKFIKENKNNFSGNNSINKNKKIQRKIKENSNIKSNNIFNNTNNNNINNNNININNNNNL